MEPSLDGVRLKLAQADKHLDLLRAYRIEHVEIRHPSVVGKYETSSGDYVFRVAGEPPPLNAGVEVSVLAHLFRSSLDNALWQLILRRGGTPRTTFGPKGSGLRPTQFPIYEDKADFDGKAKADTHGVLPVDFAVIERAQPFKSGPNLARWHPLALLGHLNNVDKHRYVHPSFAGGVIQRVIQPVPGAKGIPIGRPYLVAAAGVIRALRDAPKPRYPGQMIEAPLMDGLLVAVCEDGSVVGEDGLSFLGSDDDPTEIARVLRIKIAPGREPKMEMKPSALLDISFSDRERPVTIRDLEDIRAEVRGIAAAFGEAF